MREARRDLRRLDKFNRWLVVSYWRYLLIKQMYAGMPFPTKLAIANCFILPIMETLAPPPAKVPHLFLPIFWAGGFCGAFMLASFFPKMHKRAHWLR